jgi:hypothetical protein
MLVKLVIFCCYGGCLNKMDDYMMLVSFMNLLGTFEFMLQTFFFILGEVFLYVAYGFYSCCTLRHICFVGTNWVQLQAQIIFVA